MRAIDECAAGEAPLEHYVFSNTAPLAHIPRERRGALGDMDAAQIQALRERIRTYL